MKKQRNVAKDKSNSLSFFHKTPRTDLEKWVNSMVPTIIEAYGIGDTTVCYSTDPRNMPGRSNSDEVVFSINYDNSYKTAYIKIHGLACQMWENKEMEVLFHCITHEIAHIITSSLYIAARSRHVTRRELNEENEKTTESIAQIGRKLLKQTNPKLFIFKGK